MLISVATVIFLKTHKFSLMISASSIGFMLKKPTKNKQHLCIFSYSKRHKLLLNIMLERLMSWCLVVRKGKHWHSCDLYLSSWTLGWKPEAVSFYWPTESANLAWKNQTVPAKYSDEIELCGTMAAFWDTRHAAWLQRELLNGKNSSKICKCCFGATKTISKKLLMSNKDAHQNFALQ